MEQLINTDKTGSNGRIASTNGGDKIALVDANNCTTTNYYFQLPYNCGSGMHGPGDSGCALTGDDRAGIAQISFEVTICTGQGGGGGGTAPTPPGDYDPCNGGSPPPVVPVSYNGARGAKLMVHENPDCNPQPPVLPDLPEPPPVREIKNNLLDPCLKATIAEALASNKDVKGFIADLLKKYAGLNNGIIINIGNGDIPKAAQVSPSINPVTGVFTADITFQNGYYNDVSKEAVIAALIHEIIHAHLFQTNNNYRTLPENQQHGFLFQNFVQDIATYMISKYNMPSENAYALAWSGMGDLYNNASSTTQFRTEPNKTMTKGEIAGAVAPYKYVGTGSKGTPNCPK